MRRCSVERTWRGQVNTNVINNGGAGLYLVAQTKQLIVDKSEYLAWTKPRRRVTTSRRSDSRDRQGVPHQRRLPYRTYPPCPVPRVPPRHCVVGVRCRGRGATQTGDACAWTMNINSSQGVMQECGRCSFMHGRDASAGHLTTYGDLVDYIR